MKTGLSSLLSGTEHETFEERITSQRIENLCQQNYLDRDQLTEEIFSSEINKKIRHRRKKYLENPQQKSKPKAPKHPKNPKKIYVNEKQVRDYRKKK